MSKNYNDKMFLTCLLGVIATIGIARFAYTPMIPSMAAEIGLTDAVAGYLATANYVGYLCGAVAIAFIRDLATKAFLFKLGLILSVVTSSAMGLTTSEWLWAILRFLSGISSATGMLLGAGLLMHWYIKHNKSAVLGGFFSGLGIGIVITAVMAKLMDHHLSWALQWQAYALISLLLILPIFRWLPDFSSEAPLPRKTQSGFSLPPLFLPALQVSYFCSGIGYVVSATFLMALAESTPELQGQGWLVWLVTGIACAPASRLWDNVIDKTDPWTALFLAFLLKAASILILIVSQNLGAVITSAILYGASFIGIVSMVLAMVGRLFPENPSKPMSRLTLSYGAAQIIAPAVVGNMAGHYGNYENGLILTLLFVILGAIFLLVARWIEKRGAVKKLSTEPCA